MNDNFLRNTRYLMSETDVDRLPPSSADITLIGRSNVGKSALLCALCDNKKLARVSKTPGRTQALNVFEVNKGRWIIDMPGFGYAQVHERKQNYFSKMIGRYLMLRESLKMIFILIDGEHGPGDIDLSALQWIRENNRPHRIIITKVDKLGSRQHHRKNELSQKLFTAPDNFFWVSAKEKSGLKILRQEIYNVLNS